ncbi:hypothetical protein Barb4_04091 [Bacteroidales bacterium Barb4]|nr:hypothetical protein Barb4_04091 [Bacteroidales bacterium Barb4]
MPFPDRKKNAVQAQKTRNILKNSYIWRLNNQSIANLYNLNPQQGYETLLEVSGQKK